MTATTRDIRLDGMVEIPQYALPAKAKIDGVQTDILAWDAEVGFDSIDPCAPLALIRMPQTPGGRLYIAVQQEISAYSIIEDVEIRDGDQGVMFYRCMQDEEPRWAYKKTLLDNWEISAKIYLRYHLRTLMRCAQLMYP
jgi:hypothetical protein